MVSEVGSPRKMKTRTRPNMDWAVDARLPQRYKEWRREVRNELRLSMAEDSDKTELWACTYVVVCSGEQGEDILQQAGMLGETNDHKKIFKAFDNFVDMLRECQRLKNSDCTSAKILELARQAEYRETTASRIATTIRANPTRNSLTDLSASEMPIHQFSSTNRLGYYFDIHALDRLVEIGDSSHFESLDGSTHFLPQFLTSPRLEVKSCQDFYDDSYTSIDEPFWFFEALFDRVYNFQHPNQTNKDINNVELATEEEFNITVSYLNGEYFNLKENLVTLNAMAGKVRTCVTKYSSSLKIFRERVSNVKLSDVSLSSILQEDEQLVLIRESRLKVSALKDDLASNKKSAFDLNSQFQTIRTDIDEARRTLYHTIQQQLISTRQSPLKSPRKFCTWLIFITLRYLSVVYCERDCSFWNNVILLVHESFSSS
ncbi:hypothetical protein CAPTEDRAFT_202546 [Capitella teleta]|uniref:Uncharacterized protein n=1 Tax=Capitella teleta TaxID=283909 RepID=R7V5Z2_CAPTE|nr:hypothetical protein CAPTEDRAFT_202546 [Capitella teleta]|eukprot:ELU13902.1 hypothetical protein CAPTEDRAFT_202546 [Capitella teleta]